MRKSVLTLGVIALLTSCEGESNKTGASSDKTETFHVYGNCGMCEKTIEASLVDVDGISKADWDKNSKQIEVEFDTSKIKLIDIKNYIAKVGYDMKDLRAEESTYSKLLGCCQYDRPGLKKKKEMKMDSSEHHEGHNH